MQNTKPPHHKGQQLTPVYSFPGDSSIQVYDPGMAGMPNSSDTLTLKDLLVTLARHKWTIFGVFALILITTLLATLMMRPVYKSTTLLQVKPESNTVQFQNVEQAKIPLKEYIETQENILRSESIAKAVIASLGLESDPELTRQVKQRGLKESISGLFAQGRAALGEKIDLGPVAGDAPPPTANELNRMRLEQFSSRLTVEPIRKSLLFRVSYDSFFPETSAKITNEIARQFQRLDEGRRFETNSGAKEFLQRELTRVQGQLESSERVLTDFARSNNIVDIEDKGNIINVRLGDLSQQLTETQGSRIAAEANYLEAKAGNFDSLPSVLNEDLVKKLQGQRADLEGEIVRLSGIYKEDYPKLQQLRGQLGKLESRLKSQTSNVVNSLKVQYQALRKREDMLASELRNQQGSLLDLQDRSVQYNILKREWETNKELYSGLLERMKEVGVTAGMEKRDISVIDVADVPVHPHSPRLLLNLAVGSVFGLLAGLGMAFLLVYLDNSVTSIDDLERVTQLSNLGVVPEIGRNEIPILNDLGNHGQIGVPEMSESLRSIRTSLMFSASGGAPQVIQVTSAVPGEGKSLIASNLAVVLAQNDARVLLIDADLRKPRVHKVFDLAPVPGLTELLTGRDSGDKSIRQTSLDNLSVVPAGTITPNPSELVGSSAMTEAITQLREYYDHIVIDTPPVLGLADAVIAATKVDGVIMVASSDKTSKDAVRECVKRLRMVRAPVIGTVLNRANVQNQAYEYYGAYYETADPDRVVNIDEAMAERARASRA